MELKEKCEKQKMLFSFLPPRTGKWKKWKCALPINQLVLFSSSPRRTHTKTTNNNNSTRRTSSSRRPENVLHQHPFFGIILSVIAFLTLRYLYNIRSFLGLPCATNPSSPEWQTACSSVSRPCAPPPPPHCDFNLFSFFWLSHRKEKFWRVSFGQHFS